MNTDTDISPASNQTPNPRRATGLKAVVVALSLFALCLSYRAATEAIALYGVLEKVQAAFAQDQWAQISETKPSVAGL